MPRGVDYGVGAGQGLEVLLARLRAEELLRQSEEDNVEANRHNLATEGLTGQSIAATERYRLEQQRATDLQRDITNNAREVTQVRGQQSRIPYGTLVPGPEAEHAMDIGAMSSTEYEPNYGPSKIAMTPLPGATTGVPASLAENEATGDYTKQPSAVEQNQMATQERQWQSMIDGMYRFGIIDKRTVDIANANIAAGNFRYLNTPTAVSDPNDPFGASFSTRGAVIGAAGGGGAPPGVPPSTFVNPYGGAAPTGGGPAAVQPGAGGTRPRPAPAQDGGAAPRPPVVSGPDAPPPRLPEAGAGRPLSPPPVSPIRQTLVQNDIGEAQLAELRRLFDAGASEWIGPGAGRAEYYKQIIPGISLDEQDRQFANFQTKSNTFGNSVLKILGGVVIPPAEHARIVRQIPTEYDKKEVWLAKYEASIENLSYLRAEMARQRGGAGAAAPGAAPGDAEPEVPIEELMNRYLGGGVP